MNNAKGNDLFTNMQAEEARLKPHVQLALAANGAVRGYALSS
jgi:hypothetical protein